MRWGGTICAAVMLLGSTGCASMGELFGGESSLSYRHAMAAQNERARAEANEAAASDPSTVDELLFEGDQRLIINDRRHALLKFLEAHQVAPDDPRPMVRLGYYYLPENDERAAAIFASVIAQKPDSAAAHAGLGLARLAQDRLDEAQACFERALTADPEYAPALDAVGVLHALGDRGEEARRYGEAAVRADPRSAQALNNLGVALLRDEDFVRAEEIFRSAILLDPSESSTYNNLGLALGRQRRYDEATAAFRRFGEDQAVFNNLGYVYYLNGDLEHAIVQYERAIQAPGDQRAAALRNLKAAAALQIERSKTPSPAAPAPVDPSAADGS